MKIGFVSLMRFAPWGGSEELWSKTALLALTQGHQVETLTYDWGAKISPKLLELQKAGAITKFYTTDSRAFFDRIGVRIGLKKPKSEVIPPMQADVFVISNGSIWDFIHYRLITDKIISLGKPYLLISHNTLDYGGIVPSSDRDYASSVINGAAQRLFVSERNRQGAERQLARTIAPYRIVRNPISIKKLFDKYFPVSESLLLASVGSLDCGIKGQDLLLEALSGEKWQSRQFRLEIYGTGPDQEYLRELISFYALQDKVFLRGYVDNVDGIWERNQLLVVSSTTEGVPMVVVEAMLSGRAVLGTDVGAVDQYVQDGKTGFLVPVAKAKYLAEGLEKVWNNRSFLKQMGEDAFYRTVAMTDSQPENTFLEIIENSK